MGFYCEPDFVKLHVSDPPLDRWKNHISTIVENQDKDGAEVDETNEKKNNFIYVGKKLKIKKGFKWLATGLKEDDKFQFVSCIGAPDSNITTLINNLCEGSNQSINKNETQCEIDPQDNENKDKLEVVKNTYPRLMYLFSDIIVFVHSGSIKDRETFLQNLLVYSGLASSNSTNQVLRPHLIIILNDNNNDEREMSKLTSTFMKDKKSLELKKFYQTVSVIAMPDGSKEPIYTQQIQSLKRKIEENLLLSLGIKEKKRMVTTRRKAMTYFSRAIEMFNDNPKANFDFLTMELSFFPVNRNVGSFMFEYFVLLNNHFKKSSGSSLDSFKQSLDLVKKRIPEVIQLYIKRIKLNFKPEKIPESFKPILEEASKLISDYLPCGSILKENVCCNLMKSIHNDHHQSLETRITEPIKDDIWGRWFGMTNQALEPYQWDGPFVDPNIQVDLIKLVQQEQTKNKNQQTSNDDLDPSALQYSTRVCVGCILNFPTEPRSCGHILCLDCCKENQNICPVCKIESVWQSSELLGNSGYRILSLDGGGVRGIVECVVLKEIERLCYGIPIVQLFDYIIGTSTGGIITMTIGPARKSVEQTIHYFENIALTAFQPKGYFTGLGLIFYGAKYQRETLHKALIDCGIPETKLLTSNPEVKVAVTSVTDRSGDLELCIFPTYNRDNQGKNLVTLELNSSCLDATEASSAAGTFFPPFKCAAGTFTDGAMMENNPCYIGYRECESMFGKSRNCDIVASIGTGVWINQDNQIKNDLITFAKISIELLTNVSTRWKDLCNELEGKQTGLFRINTKLSKDYKIDDFKLIAEIRDNAKQNLALESKNLEQLSNRLLSSLFYIDGEGQFYDGKMNLEIRSKIALPHGIIEQIQQKNETELFKIQINNEMKSTKIEMKKKSISKEGFITIPFSVSTPSDFVSPPFFVISIYCNITCIGSKSNGSLISGTPFVKTLF
eukprot:gene1259-1588_t